MPRGDVIPIADRSAGDYAGKPRLAVVVQSDTVSETDSIIVCLMTSSDPGEAFLRIPIQAHAALPLDRPTWIMVEKPTAIRRERARPPIGRISATEMTALERNLAVVLGFG